MDQPRKGNEKANVRKGGAKEGGTSVHRDQGGPTVAKEGITSQRAHCAGIMAVRTFSVPFFLAFKLEMISSGNEGCVAGHVRQ